MVKNLHVQLDDELFRKFKVKCAEMDVKGSSVIRELIKRWVEGQCLVEVGACLGR